MDRIVVTVLQDCMNSSLFSFLSFLHFPPFCIKNKQGGGDPLKRNENDALALQAKVALKQKAKEEAEVAANANNKPKIVPKKGKAKNDDNLEDLLSAGLSAGKSKRAK